VTPQTPRIAPLGDAALTLTFATELSGAARRAVMAAAHFIERRRLSGVLELVPGYVSLAVHYDPFEIDYATLREQLSSLLHAVPPVAAAERGRTVTIPVDYDGPDLGEVANRVGLEPAEVVVRHTRVEYEVVLLGFVPGFAYMGPLDPKLVLPRRPSPRPRVPPGSVAIGGEQTGVYPAATPGGWHLLGRTAVRLFDPARDPPALLRVGDRVRFVAETP